MAKDGLHRWCKPCIAADMKQRREKDPQRYRDSVRKVRNRVSAEKKAIIAALKVRPCMDCGGSFHPAAMHFDHRDPSVKLFQIGRARNSTMSVRRMLAEIDKCDVVCANCHAVRTWGK